MAEALISLCLPSRGRPGRFAQMLQSARETAEGPIEVICVVDRDDPTRLDYPFPTTGYGYVMATQNTPMSGLWNTAAEFASGTILMLCADDLIFRTRGWDDAVRGAFAACPDGILLAWCDDATEHAGLATHPFISRQWYETLGQMTAPYFEAWYADSWLLDLSLKVGRQRYLAQAVIEHAHHQYGTAPDDATYQRRRAHQRSSVEMGWPQREDERMDQARKLWAVMNRDQVPPCSETTELHRYRALYEAMLYRLDNVLWR